MLRANGSTMAATVDWSSQSTVNWAGAVSAMSWGIDPAKIML